MQKNDAVRFLFLSRRKRLLMLGTCVLVWATFMLNMKQKLCISWKMRNWSNLCFLVVYNHSYLERWCFNKLKYFGCKSLWICRSYFLVQLTNRKSHQLWNSSWNTLEWPISETFIVLSLVDSWAMFFRPSVRWVVVQKAVAAKIPQQSRQVSCVRPQSWSGEDCTTPGRWERLAYSKVCENRGSSSFPHPDCNQSHTLERLGWETRPSCLPMWAWGLGHIRATMEAECSKTEDFPRSSRGCLC